MGTDHHALLAKGWEGGRPGIRTVLFVTGPDNPNLSEHLSEHLESKGVLPEYVDAVVLNRKSLTHAGVMSEINGKPYCNFLRYPKAHHLVSRRDLPAVGEGNPIIAYLRDKNQLIVVDEETSPILGPAVCFCEDDDGGSKSTHIEMMMAFGGWVVFRDGTIRVRERGNRIETSCPNGIHNPARKWPVQVYSPPSSQIATVASVQDQGVREHQQDTILVEGGLGDAELVAVVADGHGPRHLGRLAGRLSAQTFYRQAVFNILIQTVPIEKSLEQAVNVADDRVCQVTFPPSFKRLARAGGRLEELDSGSTLLALVLAKGQYYLVHVGDSRAYRIGRDKPVVALTQDQAWREGEEGVNWSGGCLRRFGWAMKSAVGHPLLRASLCDRPADGSWYKGGIWPQAVITRLDDVRPGDLLVLSSDGLNTGSEKETAHFLAGYLLGEGTMQDRLNRLMAAWHPWGSDNVSVVVVEVGG